MIKRTHWYDEAECLKHPFYMWERLTDDHVLCEDMTLNERFNAQSWLNREAQKICAYCPVKRECLKDASESDLKMTMRSGVGPLDPLPNQHLINTEGKCNKCKSNKVNGVCGRCAWAAVKLIRSRFDARQELK